MSTELMHKGVVYANDMLKNTLQLLGYYDFMETYIAINFVDFYCMTNSVLRNWVKGNERKLKESDVKGLLQTLLQQNKLINELIK